MQAVQSLCERVIQLEAGQIAASGDPYSVVSRYLTSAGAMGSEMIWPEPAAPGNNEIRLTGIRITDENGYSQSVFSSSRDILVEMRFLASSPHSALCVGFDLQTFQGNVVARTYQTDLPPHEWLRVKEGENQWRCRIPSGLLNGGLYSVAPKIGMHNMYWIVNLDPAVQFEVLLDHGVSPFWNALDKTNRPGVIAPIFKWYGRDSVL